MKSVPLYGTEFILNIKLTNINLSEIVSVIGFPTSILSDKSSICGHELIHIKSIWSLD